MKTCLVVDDSRVIRKVARRILEDLGFVVAEAGDGADALDFCRAAMPQAILLDWHMPVMNGPEFLKQLRLEPGGADPKVIFCSSETELARIREVLDAGADEFIMKPFDADIVVGKLAAAGVA
ncbi:MAG: response regulator [Phenylobacterium sp.]|nr:MAG: response regulator [Phenylobacterium sp.]